jgi:hypothetical protein
MVRPRQPFEAIVGTWNGTATIWTSNPSYPGPYTNTFSTTLTFTETPGSFWNVSNDTFSFSIPEGLITITVTLQQDSSGQTEPITGTFTPLSNCEKARS